MSPRCPTCNSPSPSRHPAQGFEGEVSLCHDTWHNRRAQPEPAAPAEKKGADGLPASADERYLRRLLFYRWGLAHTYADDGEAQGSEHGIQIDFMREPVADIDSKLRALNVARFECRAPDAAPSVEPVAWGVGTWLGNTFYERASDALSACIGGQAPFPVFLAHPPRAPLPRDEIRSIFMANGFTIKEGCDDLKEYAYEAARALLAAHGISAEGDKP